MLMVVVMTMCLGIKVQLTGSQSIDSSVSPQRKHLTGIIPASIDMKTLALWISGLFIINLTRAHGLNQFPTNFVVAGRQDQNTVTLTCNTESDSGITWRFHGDVMEEVTLDDSTQQSGPNLTMSDIDVPVLGQYSCWRGQERLSSVYLLLEAEEDSPIHCWAKSYDCDFNCKLIKSGYTAVRFGLGPDCAEGRQSCQWATSSVQLPDGGFQFKLPHFQSPYTEESTMQQVTVEAIQDLYFLRKTKRFYLRDIIQPDSPRIVSCQEVEQGLDVNIDPPSSWSTPHSFFSLEHEIEYVLKDNGEHQYSQFALIPKKISRLRVRSRDALVMSAWSEWTPWKNVTY